MRKRLLLLSLLLALGPCLLGSLPARAQDVIPIAEARQAGEGATVTVEGTVTRAFGDFVRFQDTSGPTGASALVVRQTGGDFYDDIQDGTLAPGAELQVTGMLSEFNGLLQINVGDLDSYSIGEQVGVPAPQLVTLSDLQTSGEDYESELVRIEGLRFADASGAFSADQSYTVTDGAAALVLRVQGPDETAIIGEPIPPGAFTYTGVVGQFFDDYQLIPIRPSDVQAGPSVGFAGRYALALEADDDVTLTVRASDFEDGQTASVTASVGGGDATPGDDVTGSPLPATFTLSAADPAYTLTLDPVDDMEEEGVERLEIVLESEDVIVTLERFTLWILDDPTATTTLYPELEGQALRDQLFEDFGSPPTLGYDVARDTLYGVVYNEGGIVEGYYTGYEGTLEGGDPSDELLDDGINTEHTWPQSKGAEEEPARSNMHILVPAWEEANSARSNYPYGEIPDEDTDRWFFEDEALATIPDANLGAWSEVDDSPADRSARRFEPRHRVKGDIARKLFYFRTIYPERAALSFFGAQLATLLDWNAEDSPSAEEVRRNVLIASYQGNLLNPFVLDPSLAARAYGGETEAVSIADARAAGEGATVTVEGAVTRAFGDYARVQDTSGPTGASALLIRQTFGALSEGFQNDIESGAIEAGAVLRVTGVLSEFNGLLQINNQNLAGYEIVEQGAVPAPQQVTLSDLQTGGENYESELVEIAGLSFTDASGTFGNDEDYEVTDETATLLFYVPGSDETTLGGTEIPGGVFTYTGVVGQFFDDYQLIPVFPSDLEPGEAPPQVPPVVEVDVTRTFGDPDDAQSYRLVALPGQVDRPLDRTLEGLVGRDWQAYRDTGAAADFFVQWDGSDQFTFQPGRGFWLISTEPWTVEDEFATLPLEGGAVEVPLHDGWNIISNPLDQDVAWADVEAANGGALQPLWAFAGSYSPASTFASAKTGEAFYFLNGEGLEALTLPYPTGGEAARPAPGSESGAGFASAPGRTLTLAAYRAGRRASTVRVHFTPEAAAGLDAHDWFAPPARFAALSLRLDAPPTAQAPRRRALAQEARPALGNGQRFALTLRAAPGRAVTLRARELAAFTGEQVVLHAPATDRTYDLRAGAVTLHPTEETTRLRLLIGSEAFVDQEGLPQTVQLQVTGATPFRSYTTLRYTLPDARRVRVVVYDVLGRRVRTLVDRRQRAGRYDLRLHRSAGGPPLASGLYFIRLRAGDTQRTEKVIVVK